MPGTILPAGTYVFRLLDSASNRHIVQIFNEDHTSLITTIQAIPNERLEPAGKTILTYDERPADQPMALAAWFYPGDSFGQEFVYPKAEAERLSRLNNRKVPSMESEEGQSQTAVAKPNPEPANKPAEAKQEPPPAATPAPAPEKTEVATRHEAELPHTASLLPLLGLVGFSLLGVAVLLRVALRA